ncbi:MAG: phosphate ABC transporter permease PstA [Candidatus Cloacimonetes bacterium]|nr:phosphate ABC transporter permease PstA [Candidatus Cloacimonadota bacterium]
MRKFKQRFGFLLLRLSILLAVIFLFSLIIVIIVKGAGVISIPFLTEFPKDGMTKGGIFPAIMGTFLLAVGAILFALPLGVLAAIYLREYAKSYRVVRIIRVGVNNLAGVPSVVFGLFGLAVFVKFFQFGVSLISGALTLGILILPIIIRSTEEAIATVPESFREASYGLGASKWHTVRHVVLPVAMPGILTGAILGIGRAAGETAPILFTAATFYTRRLPSTVFDEVMALPYHIYALMTEGTKPQYQVPIAYGTALVLLLLVLGINLIAIIIRYRARKAKTW